MGSADYYKTGDYNAICDHCGRKRKASECSLTWQNEFVCADTCWSPRHPQDFVTGVSEDTTVPIARPDVIASQGTTTVKVAAVKWAITIDINSIIGLVDRDSIGIRLDPVTATTTHGVTHWTYLNGTPTAGGDTVTLGTALPGAAAVSNTVYLPSIDNETWITATGITATDL